jgi:hypothetical protein
VAFTRRPLSGCAIWLRCWLRQAEDIHSARLGRGRYGDPLATKHPGAYKRTGVLHCEGGGVHDTAVQRGGWSYSWVTRQGRSPPDVSKWGGGRPKRGQRQGAG